MSSLTNRRINMFVDTTRTNIGNGTFESPYNYMPSNITTSETIYITATSIIPPIVLMNQGAVGLTLIGYHPDLNSTKWSDDSEIVENDGFIINATNSAYGIDLTRLDISSVTTALTITNARIFEWVEYPISNMDEGKIVSTNVIYEPKTSYSLGWRYVTLNPV